MSKTKLIWHSNAPWSTTGYGVQTRLFSPLLARHFDFCVSAFYGLEGHAINVGGVTVLPGIQNEYGNSTIQGHAKRWFDEDLRAGMVMTLMDVWVLEHDIWKEMNVVSWCPVDHDPAPPKVEEFFRKTGAIPVAMTRWGQERLAEFDPLYCPHAVDTKVFRPINKREAREAVTVIPQDTFTIAINAANKGNPSRKCWPEMLMAAKTLMDRHDDVFLFIHTDVTGKYGVPLLHPTESLFELLDIDPKRTRYTDPEVYTTRPLTDDMMAHVYGASDVLLNISRGEGFGIPILEAQACGRPAIVTDFSAMPEVCGAGWRVEYAKEWGPQNAWQALPDLEDTVEALEHCYRLSKAQRETLGRKARQHALNYEVGRVYKEFMLPSLREAAERLGVTDPVGEDVEAVASG